MASDSFVEYIYRICSSDKGIRADLRKADNEVFEWKAWPVILKFAGSLENDDIRRAYALIASSIAKAGRESNGSVRIGRAFREISHEASDDFSPRFMRILSSDSVLDLIRYLRPVLSFMEAEGLHLDYADLLDDILRFRFEDSRVRIKAGWVSDYLGRDNEEEEGL